MTLGDTSNPVGLDLNNPVFQQTLFHLTKMDQRHVLNTCKKITAMTWQQLYTDHGLKWEAILSRKGPRDCRLYTFSISKGDNAQ
jgi:hypothetical protein